MLADWSARRYPNLEIDLDDREEGESLRLRSPRSGRVVRLSVTYDRRYQPPPLASGEQLLLGHSRALLLPRREAHAPPGRWWCSEGRLVGDLLAERGWALAVNPQERLVATVAEADLAREAGLIQEPLARPAAVRRRPARACSPGRRGGSHPGQRRPRQSARPQASRGGRARAALDGSRGARPRPPAPSRG